MDACATPASADSLAVVIPAFKVKYLRATLNSLAEQTDRRFQVVVGNDGGPVEIDDICREFAARVDLRYHRWPENLGGRSLTSHWQRCIDLTNARWIILLGDDDQLDPACVEAFHACRVQGGDFDLYRFDTRQVDAHGRVLRENPLHPAVSSSTDFLRERFKGHSSYANEFVFDRYHFQASGGFVEFPMAWCSDDATWVRLGLRTGMARIAGPKVSWRLSGDNISSFNLGTARRKMQVFLDFFDWLEQMAGPDGPGLQLGHDVRCASAEFFNYRLAQSGVALSPGEVWRTARRLARFSGVPLARLLVRLSRVSLATWRSGSLA